MSEPVDEIDSYDRQHGDPCKTPDKPVQSSNEAWGESLNPVRETPNASSNMRDVGK